MLEILNFGTNIIMHKCGSILVLLPYDIVNKGNYRIDCTVLLGVSEDRYTQSFFTCWVFMPYTTVYILYIYILIIVITVLISDLNTDNKDSQIDID